MRPLPPSGPHWYSTVHEWQSFSLASGGMRTLTCAPGASPFASSMGLPTRTVPPPFASYAWMRRRLISSFQLLTTLNSLLIGSAAAGAM